MMSMTMMIVLAVDVAVEIVAAVLAADSQH